MPTMTTTNASKVERMPLPAPQSTQLAPGHHEKAPVRSQSREDIPTAIDLFCGAGGSTAGLRAAGYRTLVGVEYDQDAAATYRANHPGVQLFEDDINNIDPWEVAADLGMRPGQLSLLNACPPCQGFSTLGSKDQDDERNDLILSVWPWIEAFKPKAFIVENVPGIRSDHRLARVLRLARRHGYGVRAIGPASMSRIGTLRHL